ncbi:MAG: GNAT family N-acetyltransferase [Gammaproteobacteria bacterium]|nr:GNAT family N-acetyltransferase [Gammaproteobacteria bacterium]
MIDELRIRRGRRSDAEALSLLVRDVLLEYGLPPDPKGTDADVLDVERNYQAIGGEFEVLVDASGDIMGCYGLYPLGNGSCELRKMYFRPHIRGHGWGRSVLRRAIARARQMGFREMRLETASALKEAIALYEAFGFEREPVAPDVKRCDAVYRLRLEDWRYSGRETRALHGA